MATTATKSDTFAVLDKNKELLFLAARLDMCGERENAGKVYLEYVRAAAKMTKAGYKETDALKVLYGNGVYDRYGEYGLPIKDYGEAIALAGVAAEARELVKAARTNYPKAGEWLDQSKDIPELPLFREFFEFLDRSGGEIKPDDHISLLKRMRSALERGGPIRVDITASAGKKKLVDVMSAISNKTNSYRIG